MKIQHVLMAGLVAVLCIAPHFSQAKSQDDIIADFEAKRDLCMKSNNNAGSLAHEACRACAHQVMMMKKGHVKEFIDHATESCNKAVKIMDPETRDEYRKRIEIEKRQKKVSDSDALIQKDPHMTNERIEHVCGLYYRHIRYEETLPWKKFGVREVLNTSLMSDRQKQDLTLRRSELRQEVHRFLIKYKVSTSVYDPGCVKM